MTYNDFVFHKRIDDYSNLILAFPTPLFENNQYKIYMKEPWYYILDSDQNELYQFGIKPQVNLNDQSWCLHAIDALQEYCASHR
jgi:hypothetical protein